MDKVVDLDGGGPTLCSLENNSRIDSGWNVLNKRITSSMNYLI